MMQVNYYNTGASAVQIEFISKKEKSKSITSYFWSKASTIETVVYKNNGRPFSEDDFGRLRKIAEGNPDEQKIGFFGVGFYSLFSICEEPLLIFLI